MSKATVVFKKVRATGNPESFGSKGSYKFSIAVNNGKDNDGNERPADFYEVLMFGDTAKYYADKITKGTLMDLEGNLSTGSYQKDGVTIKTVSVILNNATPVGRWNGTAPATESTPVETATEEAAPAAEGEDECPFN